MNSSYTLWYCYDNTDWRIWGRYEHKYLAERAKEELKLHGRPFDSTQPQTPESYLWTVILNPGEERPQIEMFILDQRMIYIVDHDSFEETLLDQKQEEFGANVEDS